MRYPDIQFAVLRGHATANPWLAAFGATCANYKEFAGPITWEATYGTRSDMFQWFLAETDLSWLLMADDDVVFKPAESKPFLESTADVTTPHVVSTAGVEGHPQTIATTAIKFSRRAVELLRDAWTIPAKSDCGCNGFHGACVRAGFVPVKAGDIGHIIPVIAFPGPVFTPQPSFTVKHMMSLWDGDVADPVAGVCDLDADNGDSAKEGKQNGEKQAVDNVSKSSHGTGIVAPLAGKSRAKE